MGSLLWILANEQYLLLLFASSSFVCVSVWFGLFHALSGDCVHFFDARFKHLLWSFSLTHTHTCQASINEWLSIFTNVPLSTHMKGHYTYFPPNEIISTPHHTAHRYRINILYYVCYMLEIWLVSRYNLTLYAVRRGRSNSNQTNESEASKQTHMQGRIEVKERAKSRSMLWVKKEDHLQNNNRNGCTKAHDSQAVRQADEWASERVRFALCCVFAEQCQCSAINWLVSVIFLPLSLSLSSLSSSDLQFICRELHSTLTHQIASRILILKSERETWTKLKMKLTNDEPWRWDPDSIEIISECFSLTRAHTFMLCWMHVQAKHIKCNAMHEMRSSNIGCVHTVFFQAIVPAWESQQCRQHGHFEPHTKLKSIHRRHTFAHRRVVLWLLHASHNLCSSRFFLFILDSLWLYCLRFLVFLRCGFGIDSN